MVRGHSELHNSDQGYNQGQNVKWLKVKLNVKGSNGRLVKIKVKRS